MKIYNKEKTEILKNVDYDLGYTKKDILIKQFPEIKAIEKVVHYEIIRENHMTGGKELKEIIDVEGVEYQPAREEKEEILIYIPYTEKELEEIKLNQLRHRRERECFSIINRGQLWYITLTNSQIEELNQWYEEWLNVTVTKKIPDKPLWLK